jgi:hypothetical protein
MREFEEGKAALVVEVDNGLLSGAPTAKKSWECGYRQTSPAHLPIFTNALPLRLGIPGLFLMGINSCASRPTNIAYLIGY